MVLTIIILGFILFIGAVGATYIHDHMKERKVFKAKAQADLDVEMLEIHKAKVAARQTIAVASKQLGYKRVVKPSKAKTTSHKLDAQETMSLQELIDHIYKLKANNRRTEE